MPLTKGLYLFNCLLQLSMFASGYLKTTVQFTELSINFLEYGRLQITIIGIIKNLLTLPKRSSEFCCPQDPTQK